MASGNEPARAGSGDKVVALPNASTKPEKPLSYHVKWVWEREDPRQHALMVICYGIGTMLHLTILERPSAAVIVLLCAGLIWRYVEKTEDWILQTAFAGLAFFVGEETISIVLDKGMNAFEAVLLLIAAVALGGASVHFKGTVSDKV